MDAPIEPDVDKMGEGMGLDDFVISNFRNPN